MTIQQSTGIVGNQQTNQSAQTQQRKASKGAWLNKPAIHVVIGISLVAIALVLVSTPLSLFWKLFAAGTVWVVGKSLIATSEKSSFKDALWLWPQIIRGGGMVAVLIIALGSGIGSLAQSWVTWVDTAASCAADSTQPECQKNTTKSSAAPQPTVTEFAVSSATNIVRLNRPNSCSGFNLGLPVGKTVLIRYNGEGEWVTWSSGPTPRAERRVQFAEFRLAEPGGTVYMIFSCEAL